MNYRRQVLSVFKKLHQTRKDVFRGDEKALTAAKAQINEEFKGHKNQSEAEEIERLIKYAEEVELVLRKAVIQAVKTDKGRYRANIRKDLEFLDTANPYQPMPDEMIGPFKAKKGPCKDNNK